RRPVVRRSRHRLVLGQFQRDHAASSARRKNRNQLNQTPAIHQEPLKKRNGRESHGVFSGECRLPRDACPLFLFATRDSAKSGLRLSRGEPFFARADEREPRLLIKVSANFFAAARPISALFAISGVKSRLSLGLIQLLPLAMRAWPCNALCYS